MNKLPLVLVFLASFSGIAPILMSNSLAEAQVTKPCPLRPTESISAPIPIDPKSYKSPGGSPPPYIAFSNKIDGKYGEYSVGRKGGESVSIVNLTYFKQNGVQKVRIKVCGLVQNSPEIPYLVFKFGNKLIKVKALGSQNLVFTVPKAANTTTVLTALEL
jgi:hypothetical protein